jgi:hypothetical protein
MIYVCMYVWWQGFGGMEKPKGQIPHIRPMHRWHDNIKLELKEIEWFIVSWRRLQWVRLCTLQFLKKW